MEDDNSTKESGKSSKNCVSLTDSPYIGGKKMSSSLKDRLKRSRMHSSPLSRPSLPVPFARSVKFSNFINANIKEHCHTYSREEIERAMNEPEPETKENTGNNPHLKISENFLKKLDPVISEKDIADPDIDVIENYMNEPDIEVNEKDIADPDIDVIENDMNEPDIEVNEIVINESDNEINEIVINESDNEINENAVGEPNVEVKKNAIFERDIEINKNAIKESDNEINENSVYESDHEMNDSDCSKQGFNNLVGNPHSKKKINMYSYPKEDIENCAEKEKLLEIYSNLQKEATENEEILRKLKLVQKHHIKNNPDTLTDVTRKWLTCTQLALKKLYSLMPQPRVISFQDFLIFLQVDFDIVKYDPETDTFS